MRLPRSYQTAVITVRQQADTLQHELDKEIKSEEKQCKQQETIMSLHAPRSQKEAEKMLQRGQQNPSVWKRTHHFVGITCMCNGKRVCEVTGSGFGASDFCSGTFKYLQTKYTCLPAMVSTERVVTCGNTYNIQRLSCDIGVISVQAALYGRADNVTCSEGRPKDQLENTQCSHDGTMDILKKRCDGRKTCELNIMLVRTSDPCFGTYKYLETNYTCLPASAYYGRSDHTTCSYKRDPSQLENIYCSQSTHKVADSCNGKNSCSIRVGSPLFEDPCVSTHKYLELSYVCE
ncbi:L-rhamnose-binding lectin SML, partial [Nibea albiflora]